MGRTVSELDATLSPREFGYWMAFDTLEPIGLLREDYFQAHISKTIFDGAFPQHDLSFDKFFALSKFPEQPETKEQLRERIKAQFAGFV